MQSIQTKSAKETKDFAKNLAKEFMGGGIIALSGELGSGKTTFAQGFAQGLNIEEKIISPTFLIIKQYQIPGKENYFYHIDLYRLENIDLKSCGLKEILDEPRNIVLIEWAEKILGYLPKDTKKVQLKKIKEDLHEIKIQN